MTQRLLFPPQIPDSLGHFWLGLHVEMFDSKRKPCEACGDEKSVERKDCGPIYRLDDGCRICQRCLFEMWQERSPQAWHLREAVLA
jgi:hypothetical protein